MTKLQCCWSRFSLRRDAVTALAAVLSMLAAAMLVRAGLLIAFGLGGFGFSIFLTAKLASA